MADYKTGTVIQSTGSWYYVLGDNGIQYHCRMAGRYRIIEMDATNPLAVGDRVNLLTAGDETEGKVMNRLKRKNEIERRSHKSGRHSQIIAANIDLLIVIATIKYPRTSAGFIDRLLVSGEAGNIPAVLVFNKADLWNTVQEEKVQHMVSVYESAGYFTLKTSAKTRMGTDKLEELMRSKTVLLCGHSGSGKSSLLNCISPELKLQTNPVSHSTRKGRHTTTYASMYLLRDGIRVIDTPGIRDFGLMGIKKQELGHYFPEIFKYARKCRFYNCLHQNEPDCAVKEALDTDAIAQERYKSYLRILNDM